jgi:hypothetical protein
MSELQSGVGLDVGTAFIASSRLSKEGKYVEKIVRDAYFQVPDAGPFTKKLVQKANVSAIEIDNKLFVLGDEALRASAEWGGSLCRPMSNGVISAKERKNCGREIFVELLKETLGAPVSEKEKCVYSVPAKPLNADFSISYHEDLISGVLSSLGYMPTPMSESLAVVYSNLSEKNYTGAGISMGAGMCNVAVSRLSALVFEFSIVNCGDWIDRQVAESLNISISKATIAKERGVDLMNPQGEVEFAIATYYKRLIQNVMSNFIAQFVNSEKAPEFTEPISIAISGGTTKAINFNRKFEESLRELKLSFQIGEIIVGDSEFSVSRGCLAMVQTL